MKRVWHSTWTDWLSRSGENGISAINRARGVYYIYRRDAHPPWILILFSSSTAGPSSKGSTVVIIGATVAATIAFVLLFVGLKLFRRRYCGRPTKDGALVTGSDEVLLEPIQPYPYETSTDPARVPPNERATSKVEQTPQALLDPARATSHS